MARPTEPAFYREIVQGAQNLLRVAGVMNEETRNEIIHRWMGQQSIRSIARRLNVSRNTVNRVLDHYQKAREGSGNEHPFERKPRASLLDAYEETIRDYLIRYPNITVVQLLRELQNCDFQGGYTILRQRVKRIRQELSQADEAQRACAPGALARVRYYTYDIHFSEPGAQRVYLFSYFLNFSQCQYLRFCTDRDFSTTLENHMAAFQHLGGLAVSCLYEPNEMSVLEYRETEILFRSEFLSFASHYGFRPSLRASEDMPSYCVAKDFNEEVLRKHAFQSLAHLNDITDRWLSVRQSQRVVGSTNRTCNALFAEELPHLVSLPKSHWSC